MKKSQILEILLKYLPEEKGATINKIADSLVEILDSMDDKNLEEYKKGIEDIREKTFRLKHPMRSDQKEPPKNPYVIPQDHFDPLYTKICNEPSCPKCGGNIKNMNGYVCGNPECPVFPQFTCRG